MCWQPVQAAVNLSHADTSEDLKKAIEGRIQALANVHSLFVESRWIGADLSTIAAQELGPYSVQARVDIEGPTVLLEPSTAQAFAVSLHELATNAAKYGSLSVNQGQVALKWVHGADRELVLRWTETGGPPVEPPTRKGFGSRVIVGMIEQIKSTVRFDWHPSGLVCEISIRV